MAKIRVRLASEEDEGAWNHFIRRYGGSVYHAYEWRRVLERGCGYRCYYLVAEEGGEMRGVLPIATLGRLLARGLSSLPMSDYGGPVLAGRGGGRRVLEALLSAARRLAGGRGLEVRSPVQARVRRYLREQASAASYKYVTFLIRLASSFNHMWRKVFNKYLRNEIRKPMKHGIEVRVGSFPSLGRYFYRLYLMSMKRLGSPPHSFKFFAACRRTLGDERVRIFMAVKDGMPITAVLTLLHERAIYPIYAGIDPAYRRLNPLSLVLSEMVRWGCERGFDALDLGRTLYGTSSFSYKKKWGGRMVVQPYYYLWRGRPRRDPREKHAFLPGLWRKLARGPLHELAGSFLKAELGY